MVNFHWGQHSTVIALGLPTHLFQVHQTNLCEVNFSKVLEEKWLVGLNRSWQKKPFENIFFERNALEPLITDLPILIFFSTQVSLLSDNDVPTEDVTYLALNLTDVFVTYGCVA